MVLDPHELPLSVRTLVDAFHTGLENALGPRFVGLYLYGSVAFPPSAVADVDYHVLVSDELADVDRANLLELHARLESHELGDELDGYYITLEAARSRRVPRTELRPEKVDDSWALHRAHVHVGRFVLIHGPDPREILPAPTWDELDEALDGELEWLTDHLDDAPAYVVLNLCRILYSYENRDVVVSKLQAGIWALAYLPVDHHELVRASLAGYGHGETRDERYVTALGDVRGFYAQMRERIASARSLV